MSPTRKLGSGMLQWSSISGSAPRPIVVSYFTDTFYLREAFELARTCQAFGVDFQIEEVPDLGDWMKNTNFKPSYIRSRAVEHPDRSLLWIDADGRIRAPLKLFDEACDPEVVIGYRTFPRSPASGTVILPPHLHRVHFLDVWIEECRNHPDLTDQVCMGRAVSRTGVKRLELPAEYCVIFDIAPNNEKLARPTPDRPGVVIEHMQASRWTRRTPLPKEIYS